MRHLWAAIILLLALGGSGFADSIELIPIKAKGAGPLFRTNRGSKWGYMDRGGRLVIPPQFDGEGEFFSGLASVQKNGKWGYVDEFGRVRIPYQYDDAGAFQEGVAPVQVGRQWGYIDSTGKMVIRPQFQGAGTFSNGMGRVAVWETMHCDRSFDSASLNSPAYTKDDAPLGLFSLYLSPHGESGAR